jgi:hypothetical protein
MRGRYQRVGLSVSRTSRNVESFSMTRVLERLTTMTSSLTTVDVVDLHHTLAARIAAEEHDLVHVAQRTLAAGDRERAQQGGFPAQGIDARLVHGALDRDALVRVFLDEEAHLRVLQVVRGEERRDRIFGLLCGGAADVDHADERQ